MADESAPAAEEAPPPTHSEYYHTRGDLTIHNLINEEWEPIGYKDTTSISFNAAGTLCAFGKVSSAVDLYDIGAVQTKACTLQLKDIHPDGSSYTSYYAAWAADSRSIMVCYSGSGEDMAVLWDVCSRKPSHVARWVVTA